jgi:prepilin-type N-terminal cleavage/methylation domain-containing protein
MNKFQRHPIIPSILHHARQTKPGTAIAGLGWQGFTSNHRTRTLENFGEYKKMKRNQSGFTLIEIAIVLVIIGLLLGGVLKGQELINSAKVKNLATDFKNIPIYIYGYQDKFRALPGDDANVDSHLAGLSAQSAVNAGSAVIGNGVIEGNWDASGTAETNVFWQHVRLANLAPGPTAYSAGIQFQPTNSVGGLIGITNSSQSPITGMRGSYIICSDAIAGKFAKQLDITMDDGATDTGSMRAVKTGTTGAALSNANVNDDLSYLVCMGF